MHTDDKKRTHGVEAYLTNRLGHAAGRGIIKAVWARPWFRALVARYPELAKLIGEGAVALTSLLEVGGDHPIVRALNFVAESVAMENLELLEQFEKDPENAELAKKAESKIESAVDKAGDMEAFLVLEHVHKDKACLVVAQYVTDTTPAPRPGKDGKVFTSPSAARIVATTMSSAMSAGKPLCSFCFPPPAPIRKPETKQAPAEKAIAPGRNFMEHLMRFRKEDAAMFEIFWTEYLRRVEGPDGSDLARKFADAFNGRYDYEAFLFVATLPSLGKRGHEEWHHALDALLGKTPPPSGYKGAIGGLISKELKESERMVMNFVAWVKKGNEARALRIAERRAENDRLDAEWEAQKKARKRSKLVSRIVFASLAVAASAVWFLTTTL